VQIFFYKKNLHKSKLLKFFTKVQKYFFAPHKSGFLFLLFSFSVLPSGRLIRQNIWFGDKIYFLKLLNAPQAEEAGRGGRSVGQVQGQNPRARAIGPAATAQKSDFRIIKIIIKITYTIISIKLRV
jgi:hypothetical protein